MGDKNPRFARIGSSVGHGSEISDPTGQQPCPSFSGQAARCNRDVAKSASRAGVVSAGGAARGAGTLKNTHRGTRRHSDFSTTRILRHVHVSRAHKDTKPHRPGVWSAITAFNSSRLCERTVVIAPPDPLCRRPSQETPPHVASRRPAPCPAQLQPPCPPSQPRPPGKICLVDRSRLRSSYVSSLSLSDLVPCFHALCSALRGHRRGHACARVRCTLLSPSSTAFPGRLASPRSPLPRKVTASIARP